MGSHKRSARSAPPAAQRERGRQLASGTERRHHAARHIGLGFRLGRDAWLLVVIAVGTFAALSALGASIVLSVADRDWAQVASVNGTAIDRAHLRARVPLVEFLAEQRASFDHSKHLTDVIGSSEDAAVAQVATAALDDPVGAAQAELVDEALLIQLATTEHVALPPVDAWKAAADFVSGDVAHLVRYVRFALPSPPTGQEPPVRMSANDAWPHAETDNVAATRDRLQRELAANSPVETIVAGLRDAGWQVVGLDTVVSAAGNPADPALDLDPSIAAAVIHGQPNAIVGPTTDEYGRVSAGRILAPPDRMGLEARLASAADEAHIEAGSLHDWAEARALRDALTDTLLTRWRTEPVEQAHIREIVVGPAAVSGADGPWVELSQLLPEQLRSVPVSAIPNAPPGLQFNADALARTLRTVQTADRRSLFSSLVAAAQKAAGPDPASRSGYAGFVAEQAATPELAKAAFAKSVRTGDVLGPITTSAGPTLFLVEARYPGMLDDRSETALAEIRADAHPDPVAYTSRFSPADVALARDAGWHAAAEFSSGEPAREAMFETPIGAISDPYALDGKLAVAIVDARRTALPDARMLDRLALDGFNAWFSSARSKATITKATDPLPELDAPTASPSPTLPAMPDLPTPNLPSIPALPAGTPGSSELPGPPSRP